MKEAKAGRTTPEMELIAKNEKVSVDLIRKGIASGRIVIFKSTTSAANRRGIVMRPAMAQDGMRTRVMTRKIAMR